MKRLLVFWTPFNRAQFTEIHENKDEPHPTETEEWIKPRMKIWKQTALRSILRQKVDDWRYFFCCNPDTQHILDRYFEDYCFDKRVKLQYSGTLQAMEEIRDVGCEYDECLVTRLDSDDMYHPLAGRELMDNRSGAGWFMWNKGYGYRKETNHMWIYQTRGSGPFFSQRMTGADFANLKTVTGPSHVEVIHKNPEILPAGRFIVNITGMNTTTCPRTKNFGDKVTEPKKSNLLMQFGVI